ncbi:MAG: cobyrinate a,c-diamide synthase [Hyphomicrobiaceae bacterium]
MTARGLIVGAPTTGSGKTTVTLGLIRALSRTGASVAPAKIGPDYIDPQFHHAAAGRPSVNLDAWAMRPAYLYQLISALSHTGDIAIVEGVMGLFDGGQHPGRTGIGSTADIARETGWPVLLVINCAGLAQSVAPLAKGFQSHAHDVQMAGVILNNVSSERHRDMLESALKAADIPVLGAIPREETIQLPSRHLGLKQAEEHGDLDHRLDQMADLIEQNCDLEQITAAASPLATRPRTMEWAPPIKPFGQRIAVAQDMAFRFAYPHLLQGWCDQGAELSFFSPLADETAQSDADAIYLPGGYPELHGATLADAARFRTSIRDAADNGKIIYGECGGYMVLGNALTDADGTAHEMLGLLNVKTSFATPKLHLGYRHVRASNAFAAGEQNSTFYAHEFHYAATSHEDGDPLFTNLDTGEPCGLRNRNVAGSFIHLIDAGD